MAQIKIEIVYDSVEAAVVALGKLASLPAATTAVVEQPKPAERTRKPRADAGQPRGPNARTTEQNANAGGTVGAGSAPVTGGQSVSPTGGTPPAAAPAVAPQVPAPQTPPPAQPAATAPSADDVQKAVEKLFNARGFDDCQAALSRFGVKRGKDLDAAQRAEFIAKAEAMVADKNVQP